VLSIAGSAIKSDGHLPRIREKLGAMSSGQSFEAPSRVIELTPAGLALEQLLVGAQDLGGVLHALSGSPSRFRAGR